MTTTETQTITTRIETARSAAGVSQRDLARRTGISQSTLSRITRGKREATLPELLAIAEATGHTLTELTGSPLETRVHWAARATNGAQMDALTRQLLHFLELDAYLDDQAIPAV